MRNLKFFWLCCLLLICAASVHAENLTQPQLLPYPAKITAGKGAFSFTAATTFAVENDEQAAVVSLLTDLFTHAAGFTPEIKVGSHKGDVVFTTDKKMADEAYELKVSAKKISIRAANARGLFYALQSLRQMLPADIDAPTASNHAQWTVPAVSISDSPRFGYRALMMDVARFFTPKEHMMRIIDVMAMLKLNKLHIHLCDDNGWRIEIKKYPKLTEVGSRRVERPGLYFPERYNPRQWEPTVEKGYYTQDDCREIVAYAQKRFIEVVPEIEMPAHSNAALASYPQFACPVVDKFIGVLPGLGGDHADIIYCAGNDSVYTFLQDILDEVMAIFPSHYIHLGGDEAWKTHWKECPLCQARIKAEGLHNEEELQGYFMGRMARYVQSKGREVIGWDELTNSKIPENAIIIGWQGLGQAAVKAGKLGHRFIMSPARAMYLIRYQGPQWFEPYTYFGNNTLKDVYTYEAVKDDWTPELESLQLGVQASLWTEFCNSTDDVDYLLFPRLMAMAEGGWTSRQQKDWPRFLKALDSFNQHMSLMGFKPAGSMYNIQHTVTPKNGALQVKLECIRPDMEIRYTTDGSTPTAQSALYQGEFSVNKAQTINAATFADGKQMGALLTVPISWNKATGKSVKSANGNLVYTLTNGVRGSNKHTDSEWASWSKNDSISIVLDLAKKQSLGLLTVGLINNYGMNIHLPSNVTIMVSDDGKSYQKAAERSFEKDVCFRKGTFKEDVSFDLAGEARYVRIDIRGAGISPKTHVRPSQESKVYVDEIILNDAKKTAAATVQPQSDETLVYANPGAPLRECLGAADATISGTSHPTQKGWFFYTAHEFLDRDTRNGLPLGFVQHRGVHMSRTARVDNARCSEVADGVLRIHAIEEPDSIDNGFGKNVKYSHGCYRSAQPKSKEFWCNFTENMRIEIRFRRTPYVGFNDALWMMGNNNRPWPANGEIDILENPKKTLNDRAHFTLHSEHAFAGTIGGKGSVTSSIVIDDMSKWNIYWVELLPDRIIGGVNGKAYFEHHKGDNGNPDWPWSDPEGFFMIFSTGISTNPEAWGGAIDASLWTEKPTMEIDWVRVYVNDDYKGAKAPTPKYY